MTKQLQKGHGLGFLPAEKSPTASNPRKERQLALESIQELPYSFTFLNLTSSGKNTDMHQTIDQEFLAKVN